MLLYSLLHLAEVPEVNQEDKFIEQSALTLDDLTACRQLDGECPGRPECGVTSEVETITGPLGEGSATSVARS